MSLLNLLGTTPQDKAKDESEEHSLRAEMVKRIALGGGWSIGASIIFGAYELIRSNPHDAFPLLRSWGPWAIVTLVALYFGYDVLKIFLNVGVRLVTAVEQLAAAQQQTADKDDRQIQEIQTLASFSAQESERTSSKMAELMALLKDSLSKSDLRSEQLDAIDKKLSIALQGRMS